MPDSAPPPPPPPVIPVPNVDTARASVAQAEARLEDTLRRASTFAEAQRQQRVDDEWSTVESLRHLVLVIDVWLSRAVLGETDPFDPMALPPSFMPPSAFEGTSIDLRARPSFDEAAAVVRTRFVTLRRYVDTLTADELTRPIEAHARTVGGALNVIFTELAAHDYYINRDLDTLAAPGVYGGASTP